MASAGGGQMISKSEAEDNEISMASNAANENVAGFKGHAAYRRRYWGLQNLLAQ
jgi:hypothetical protein